MKRIADWNKPGHFCWNYIVMLTLMLTLSISSGQAFAALFQNGDFSNGFAGWSGELTFSGEVDPSTDPHFIPTAQGIQIGNDDFEFFASVYQDFQMASLASPNNNILLSLWLQWSPIDSGQTRDMFATLYEYDPLSQQYGASLDLLSGVTMSDLLAGTQLNHDVTSFAAKSVRLVFGVSDLDFITPDHMTVGAISFAEQTPNPVPIPSSLVLLISGLAGFGIFRRKRSSYASMGREL